jgi:hypothetical protein
LNTELSRSACTAGVQGTKAVDCKNVDAHTVALQLLNEHKI